jgi:hypothetical protein
MKCWIVAGCAMTIALAPALAAGQGTKRSMSKVERLACRLGTEDHHARIGVELIDGKVARFAYYSKSKPRTCSINIERDGPYSTWKDVGTFTQVTTDHGLFLIEHRRRDVNFLFHDVDRHFYCGMEPGLITGTLTVIRGRTECLLDGVMRAHDDVHDVEPGAALAAPGVY